MECWAGSGTGLSLAAGTDVDRSLGSLVFTLSADKFGRCVLIIPDDVDSRTTAP